MINDKQDSITFQMRIGKKLEFVFGVVWFLGITAFLFWIYWTGTDHKFGPGSLFFIFLSLLSLAFVVIFGNLIAYAKLIISASGITFQSAFKRREYPWKTVNGLYFLNGETYLSTIEQDPKKNPLSGIPLSWFTKFSYKKGTLMTNSVLEAIQHFAPERFKAETDTQEAAFSTFER